MSAQGLMNPLEERKRLIRLQAGLHRAVLRAECSSFADRLRWVDEAREKARSAKPWLTAGAAAVGLLAATKGARWVRWLTPALAAVRWWRTFK